LYLRVRSISQHLWDRQNTRVVVLSALVWQKLIIYLHTNYIFRTSTNDSWLHKFKFVAGVPLACISFKPNGFFIPLLIFFCKRFRSQQYKNWDPSIQIVKLKNNVMTQHRKSFLCKIDKASRHVVLFYMCFSCAGVEKPQNCKLAKSTCPSSNQLSPIYSWSYWLVKHIFITFTTYMQ
jgi:hypothetical protein